ncbi:MAG: CBS domain-containing protein [Fidelibacterota bacterium]|nr:MAG: CBS domain-containing protein [Candidatus Neomarinimicrobiota bacterium]
MTFVSDLLETKQREPLSITLDTSVYDALRVLADTNVGALLVLDGAKLVGIFSERDYARKIGLEGKFSNDTLVKDVMSSEVMFVRPEQTIEECMALMTSKDIRYLPVLEEEALVGLISIGDVVRAVIADKNIEIQQLENYVTGLLYGG